MAASVVGLGGVAGCVGGSGGGGESITVTLEGGGDSLRELEIENDGAVFFEIESDSRVVAEVVPEGDGGSASVRLEPFLGRAKYRLDIGVGNYAVNVRSDGDWVIEVEQHPPSIEADKPEFPLVIEGDTIDVFGPFQFDGFMNVETVGDAHFAVGIVDASGSRNGLLIHRPNTLVDEGYTDHGTINKEGAFWVESTMDYRFIAEHDNLDFKMTFNQPD